MACPARAGRRFWRMLQSNTSSSDAALFDAILAFFAHTDPSSGAFYRGQSDAASMSSPAQQRDRQERVADASRVVVAILGALTLVSAVLVVIDLHAIQALVVEPGLRSPGDRIAVVVLILVIAELLLIGAVAVQDRRRRQVEALLRESENRIAFAAEAAALGLWRWEAQSDSFWATERCNRILGIPVSAQPGMNGIVEAVHPDDRPKVLDALRHGVESGATFEIELRLALGGGGWRWVRVRARPERGADGRIVQIAGTIIDISDSVALHAEIDKQQHSLTHLTRVGVIGELSGALAHELNQPLTAILSNAQAVQRMIGQKQVDMAEIKSAIADIIEDDARAGEVIRHLRTLLKKGEAQAELVPINALLRKTLALARNDLTGRHIVVATELSEAPLAVWGDTVQLQQLILNLVLNAADAIAESGGGGVLQVIADLEEAGVRISVADTGPGIKPEDMDKLFEPFFSTKKQGLGLGLSISRSIAAGHGGTIWAENNSGRGATFHVSLPRARGARDDAA